MTDTDPAVDARAVDPEVLRERAVASLVVARDRTTLLTSCVEDPDLTAQHSPLMSPLVWDLAHIGNQEEQWLLRAVAGHEAIRPEIDGLYDAFEHPRAERPKLPLLSPAQARTYAADVRGRALDVLERHAFHGTRLTEAGFAFGMIAQHEQQHDETMLITHQLRTGPPALTAPDPEPAPLSTGPSEVLVPGGPFTMGTSGEPWALDNERPAHRREVAPFHIDTTPVTNGAYRAFIEDGGYDNPRWWAADGWAHIQKHGIDAPLFWRRDGKQFLRRRFGVTEVVPADEPVLHVSWYEADAYARWAGRRLPTEAEWEKAARGTDARRFPWGNSSPTLDHANFQNMSPTGYDGGLEPVGTHRLGDSPFGISDLAGNASEWVSDWYSESFATTDVHDPDGPDTGERKVIRGGGRFDPGERMVVANRYYASPDTRGEDIGFRCASDAG